MLVLGRCRGDKILIGDDMSVTLEDTRVESVFVTIQEGTRFPYRKNLREGEKFQLTPDVVLELLRVRRGQARFGIIAPLSICILRSELAGHSEDHDLLLEPELGGESGGA